MIAQLRGVVVEKKLSDAVVDVNGVGYRVHFSLLTLARLPEEGQPVRVRVRTVVREDALDLFGFLSRAEEEMFQLLTSVSNVGPRLAMTVLSGMEVRELNDAIGHGDVARLTKVHGIGKKTAERLVVELREKVKLVQLYAEADGTSAPALDVRGDLVSALVNLGYKAAQAEKAADVASQRAGTDAPFELMFREALKGLRSGA
jgi:Holliday junction DNA helicase RuvA